MSERAEKKSGFSLTERMIMEGLVHRIIIQAGEGNVDLPIIKVAQQIKADAEASLDKSNHKNDDFFNAIDRIIGFIEENPEKSILDLFRENKKKK